MIILCKNILQVLKQGGILLWLYLLVLLFSIHGIGVYCTILFSIVALVYLYDKRYNDAKTLWLLLFSILYVVILFLSGNVGSYAELIGYAISPYAFYRFGKFAVDKYAASGLLGTFVLLTIFVFALNLYASTIQDINSNGFMNLTRALETEGRESAMNATLLGLNASLGFMGLATCFAYPKFYRNVTAILFILMSVMSLVVVLHLVNRTGIVVLVAVTLVAMTHMLRKHKGRMLVAMFAVFLILGYCLQSGLLNEDLFMAYAERNEETDIASGGDRFWRWGEAIHHMFAYPLGWSTMRIKDYYVHNLWLDVARVAGIIPFLCLMIATILSVKDVFKIYKAIPTILTTMLIVIYLCFFISSMVEPVIEGFPLYFYLFCMVWGMNARIIH